LSTEKAATSKPYLSPTLLREVIEATSEEAWLKHRTRDITSTEVSALFGLSPYLTPFELWHRKKAGDVVKIEPSERMKWGTRLQASIAAGLAEDHGWKVAPRQQYERIPEKRLGASYDFTIVEAPEGCGLLEIKNVDSMQTRDQWVIDGDDIEAPPHIEMQVQHQLLVSGLPFAYIGALVGGNRGVLIRREPQPGILDMIVERTEEFWRSIEAGEPPKPDFEKDAQFLKHLYQTVHPGTVAKCDDDAEMTELARQYKIAMEQEKAAEALKASIQARIFAKIGDSEKAIGNGFTISAGAVKATTVPAYERAAYRGFRLTFKKES
jgi:putative phage-type endonuclease